jgi:hypothetical protein
MSTKVGLGTAIRGVTRAMGIPHCRGCAQRQKRLDKAVPHVWPPPNLRRWLEARAQKRAEREANAKRNATVSG